MSKARKTRKEKIRSQKRIKAYKEELLKLKTLKEELEKQQEQLIQKKEYSKMNLWKLIAPFFITAGITASTIKFFGGGLPFYRDHTTKYRKYDLEYDTEGHQTLEKEYGFKSDLIPNSLIEEEQIDQNTRIIRNYIVENIDLDLINAILEKDYNYIHENLPYFDEETFYSNLPNKENLSDSRIQASLHMIDKKDAISTPESTEKNNLITILNLLIIQIINLGYTKLCDIDNKWKKNTSNYREAIETQEELEEQLEENRKKRRTLSKKMGGI
ncbi:MAG: hypothetical protein IJ704_02865 [Bacilli bacterium]|nr:hypothetical protein [Bacilli bacterium]